MAQPVPVSKRSGPANAGLARTAAAKELINITDFIVHILPPSLPLRSTNKRDRNSLRSTPHGGSPCDKPSQALRRFRDGIYWKGSSRGSVFWAADPLELPLLMK